MAVTTPLVAALARQIGQHIRASGLQPGEPLTERELAKVLRVSRSPVRRALHLLAERRMVVARPRGGYALARNGIKQSLPAGETADNEEALYLRMANDHLSGALPERISERALCRRYDLSRSQAVRLLARAGEEGWAQRLPGHGWSLQPVIVSTNDLAESYRFRMIIEPAGLLEPGFQLNVPALHACKAEILSVLDGRSASAATIFALGLSVHEQIMRCSNNLLLIESLVRVTRLRRLAGYRRNVDRHRLLERCKEHIALLDMVLAGKNRAASELLRRHIEADMREKLGQVS